MSRFSVDLGMIESIPVLTWQDSVTLCDQIAFAGSITYRITPGYPRTNQYGLWAYCYDPQQGASEASRFIGSFDRLDEAKMAAREDVGDA